MIAAFSTSSPVASVALLATDGRLLYSAGEPAQGRAGEACLRLLQAGLDELNAQLSDVTLFAADLGPGSFTGVRVGIVLAKTLAWQQNAQCAGADAFDLVDPSAVVVLPSRKGEWFVRTPGSEPIRTREVPETVHAPSAAGFSRLPLKPVSPYELVPGYLLEPSISTPKEPFKRPEATS